MSLIKNVNEFEWGGNMRQKRQETVNSILELIDDLVQVCAQKQGLTKNQVRLLRPCSFAVFKEPYSILLVIANTQSGEIPKHIYFEKSKPDINFKAAFVFCRKNLNFDQPFNFVFPKQLLNYKLKDIRTEINTHVQKYIEEETQNFEALQI